MADLFWKGVLLVWGLYMINVFLPDLVISLEPHRDMYLVNLLLDTWILIKIIALVAVIVIGVRWVTDNSR